MDSLIIWVVLLVIAIVIVSKTVKIVPQQHAGCSNASGAITRRCRPA